MYIARARCKCQNGSGVRWAEWLLVIGTGCRVKIFSLILDSSVGLSAGIPSAGDWISETLWVRILHSAEEDNLSLSIRKSLACSKLTTYIYIYILNTWGQMLLVFFHDSAQRNDSGHLIDENVFKTTRLFCYPRFHVTTPHTPQANANKPFCCFTYEIPYWRRPYWYIYIYVHIYESCKLALNTTSITLFFIVYSLMYRYIRISICMTFYLNFFTITSISVSVTPPGAYLLIWLNCNAGMDK